MFNSFVTLKLLPYYPCPVIGRSALLITSRRVILLLYCIIETIVSDRD